VQEEWCRVYGKRVSLKKAARLMREHGLNARRRRKYIPRSNHGRAVCETILNRQFCAGKPGEKRVSDIAHLRTSGARVYLTMIPDRFERKVTGGAFSGGLERAHGHPGF
jgi:transposase InsO family protein